MMRKLLLTGLLLFLAFMFTVIGGCGTKPSKFNELATQIGIAEKAPVLKRATDPVFYSYVERFEDEAFKITGHEISARDVAVTFDSDYFKKEDRQDMLGVCVTYNEDIKEILVNSKYWFKISAIQKEILIFHEMGHCKLGRDHDDSKFEERGQQLSMMTTYILTEKTYTTFRTDYLIELFHDNDIPLQQDIELALKNAKK